MILGTAIKNTIESEKFKIDDNSTVQPSAIKPQNKPLKNNFDADLCFFDSDLKLSSVIANGKFMMKDGDLAVKGSFEK